MVESPFRYPASVIHQLLVHHMAICPAGPPKLMKPSSSQSEMPARRETEATTDEGLSLWWKNDRFAHDCQTSFLQDLSKPSNSEQAAASSWSSSVMVSRSPARMLSTPAASGVGSPTDVQEVDQPSQTVGDHRVQHKTPDQYFEGHQRADMAEWRAVKIKTDRRRRTGLGRGQPQEPRLVVNKRRISRRWPDDRPTGVGGGPQPAAKGASCPAGSVRPPPTAARSAIAAD